MSVFYLTLHKEPWWDSRIDGSPGSTKDQKWALPLFLLLFPIPSMALPFVWACAPQGRYASARWLQFHFQTLPGSILHNIMITVWGKCLLGMKKRSCGWKMMFPHNYARTVWDSHPLRPPLHLLAIREKKEGERILLLPAASKLWSESERCAKYHSCILRSMTWLPESWDQWCPLCSHCRLLLFFCFFLLMVMCYSPVFPCWAEVVRLAAA